MELEYIVSGMHCSHCLDAVTSEVELVAGVTAVDVDLDSKIVRVRGENVSDAEVRAAIEEAGYEAA